MIVWPSRGILREIGTYYVIVKRQGGDIFCSVQFSGEEQQYLSALVI